MAFFFERSTNMDRARIDGMELEYEVRGAGEPVVLVHGSHIADAFAPLLAEPVLTEQYRLILYHRRGLAGSTHPDGPLSTAQQAADCRALMQRLDVPRAHVVGHGYGGVIALQLALDTPEAVHSLALLEPPLLSVPSTPQFFEAVGPVLQMYEAGNKAGAVDGFLQALAGPEYRNLLDRVLPSAFAQAVADADTFFRIELPVLQQWHFTEAEAWRITQPVLSVLGADSPTLWPGFAEIHQLIQSWLPQAETFVLGGAIHQLLQIVDSKGLAEGLAGFFARHPLPARL
jgi:pimeloyl-ACP methyl ester carboxylesterase